jgi:hypothetical protein
MLKKTLINVIDPNSLGSGRKLHHAYTTADLKSPIKLQNHNRLENDLENEYGIEAVNDKIIKVNDYIIV